MGEERQPGRRLRPDNAQALEEIRQLFARYRQIAKREAAMGRGERPQSRTKRFASRVRDSRDAPVPSGR